MKKILNVILLLFHFGAFTQEQNIVTNGDFEKYRQCPFGLGQLDSAIGWFRIDLQSPDYFNSCATSSQANFYNFWGVQQARSGNGYAGGAFFDPSIEYNREHLINTLHYKLEIGNKYKFTMFVSLADCVRVAISNVEAILLKKNPYYYSLADFQQEGSLVSMDTSYIIINKKKWIKLYGDYISKGGEKYLAIGNFRTSSNTKDSIVNTNPGLNAYDVAYYYIDDVSLYEIIIPQDISIDSLFILSTCYDSIGVKITNSGDSALDFLKYPFTLTLDVKQNGTVVQQLQKTIQDNQQNPLAGEPLAVDSSFWFYFSGISYPTLTGNYTIEVNSQMTADGDSLNNFLDTSFYRAVSVGNVSISDSSICKGESLQLYGQYVKGSASWQFSNNQQNWKDIGFADTLTFIPKESAFFRLVVCGLFSDTFEVIVKPLPPVINAEFQFCSPGQQLFELDRNDSISNVNWYTAAKDGSPFHQGFSFSTIINESITYYLESVTDKCVSKERGVLKITIGGCELEIPNIFTPNGDGINDVFEYRQSYGKEIKTIIYNRWGAKIEEFNGASGWTGKGYKSGTYFYVIEADGEVYRGSVMLVR